MGAQVNYKVLEVFSVLFYSMHLQELDQMSMQPKFFVYIFKSMLKFNFEIFPISFIDSIRMCGTILMPLSQSILFTMFDCQFYMVMVGINVNKVTVLFKCKNPS